jgi:hypothetical protein
MMPRMIPAATYTSQPGAAAPSVGRLVDQCPECGYSLEGLPDEGICPECGQRYDQTMIVLHGTARGRLASLGNAAPRAVIWHVVWGVLAIACFTDVVGVGRHRTIPMILIAYGGVMAALALARRFLADRPGLVQDYLRPDGFLQRDHDDRSLIYVLDKVIGKVIAIVVISLALVASGASDSFVLGVIGLSVAALIFGGAMAYHFVAHRPDRRRTALSVFKLWRRTWREANLVLFEPAGSSTFRLQLWHKGGRSSAVTYFVDAEVTCTPEQAARVRALILGWMSAAPGVKPAPIPA